MKLHINESAAYNLDNAESRRKEIGDRFGGEFTPDDHILICKDNKKLNIQVGKKYKCTATNGQRVEIVSIDKLFPEDTGNSALITAYYRGKMICIASNQLYESVNKKNLFNEDAKFDKLELSSYIQDCVEEALERLVDTKLTANVIAQEVPGYNQDWCANTFNSNYTKKIMQIVTDLTALYTDISLANRKDNE